MVGEITIFRSCVTRPQPLPHSGKKGKLKYISLPVQLIVTEGNVCITTLNIDKKIVGVRLTLDLNKFEY